MLFILKEVIVAASIVKHCLHVCDRPHFPLIYPRAQFSRESIEILPKLSALQMIMIIPGPVREKIFFNKFLLVCVLVRNTEQVPTSPTHPTETTQQHNTQQVKQSFKRTFANLRLKLYHTQLAKPSLTLGVVHVGSGGEVDDVVVELLPAEPLDQGRGDEGLPHAGLAHHHQRQLVLDTQVQEIFLNLKQKLSFACICTRTLRTMTKGLQTASKVEGKVQRGVHS